MKRHERLFGPNHWGAAVMACLVGTSTVSAQLSMPGMNLPSKDNSGAATAAVPSYAQGPSTTQASTPRDGKVLVQQARAAIAGKQFESAVQLYRAALAATKNDPNAAADVARLRVDLQIAGIDAELLNMPATMANGIQAKPIPPAAPTNLATAKRQVLRLIAQGRLALDQGDTRRALQFARQAQQFKIPESAFAPGEPRVWDFVLDAESAAKRAGTMDNQIALAGGTQSADGDEAGFIKQMLFSGDEAGGGAVRSTSSSTRGSGTSGEQLGPRFFGSKRGIPSWLGSFEIG